MKGVLSALCALMAAGVLLFISQDSSAVAAPRIDLKVLVVTDGDPSTPAIADHLAIEGVPYTLVNLADKGRPTIDDAFLQDTVDGMPHAKYQAVVLPNADPFRGSAETAALAGYEKKFGIRQVDAYVYPNAAVGLSPPAYAGTLDGAKATISPSGLTGVFRYLKGPVTFEESASGASLSYGYLATPLPNDPKTGTSFEPLMTATAPGGGATGTIAGVYTHDGRSELALTYAYNNAQWQFRTIAHGLVTWMTKGVHLGYSRNYFEVHVDDVFLGDYRWNVHSNCTAGSEGCSDPNLKTAIIRMVPADVTAAANWQTKHHLLLDMLYNGQGSDRVMLQNHSDPLLTAFLARRKQFRWVNHTFEHLFVGCVQDFTVMPWRCVTNPDGSTRYMGKAGIMRQISKNVQWAHQHKISIHTDELVTGEHSGLRILPQQPADNPALAPSLSGTGIKWLGSDASRMDGIRQIGSAVTQPRYPLATFYNVGTAAEEVAEYNWIYTSKAHGGSGICEANPATMTCLKHPLDKKTGYLSYIVPTDAMIDLAHILSNDPRSHYAHQSNLADDRILYPLLDRILGQYGAAFAANTPLVNLRMSGIGAELGRLTAWRAEQKQVTAYEQGGTVVVQGPAGLAIPVTVPDGTVAVKDPFGGAYAGERSGYVTGGVTLTVPPTAQGH